MGRSQSVTSLLTRSMTPMVPITSNASQFRPRRHSGARPTVRARTIESAGSGNKVVRMLRLAVVAVVFSAITLAMYTAAARAVEGTAIARTGDTMIEGF